MKKFSKSKKKKFCTKKKIFFLGLKSSETSIEISGGWPKSKGGGLLGGLGIEPLILRIMYQKIMNSRTRVIIKNIWLNGLINQLNETFLINFKHYK